MTQPASTFQTLSAFSGAVTPTKAQESFVPFQAFGASTAATSDANRQQKLMNEVELKRQEAIQEIQQKEESLNARETELNQRQQALEQAAADLEQKQAQLLVQIQTIQQIADTFESMKKSSWAQNASEVVDFSLALMERLFQARLIDDPNLLVTQIRSSLEDMKVDGAVTIRLAPESYEALTLSQKKEVQDFLAHPNVKLVSDLKLKNGDVLIDTQQFRLDASLSAALANLKEDLNYKDQNLAHDESQQPEKKDE